jgi:hypothetical protein
VGRKRAREICDKPIRLVFGGFHLGRKSDAEMQEIIAGFKSITTKRINELRGTPGKPVWPRNYYEHIIRDEADWPQPNTVWQPSEMG